MNLLLFWFISGCKIFCVLFCFAWPDCGVGHISDFGSTVIVLFLHLVVGFSKLIHVKVLITMPGTITFSMC